MQGAQVQYLVKEQRSHMLQGTAKKKKISPIILLHLWIYSRISSWDTLNIRGTQQILTERINPQCTFPTCVFQVVQK